MDNCFSGNLKQKLYVGNIIELNIIYKRPRLLFLLINCNTIIIIKTVNWNKIRHYVNWKLMYNYLFIYYASPISSCVLIIIHNNLILYCLFLFFFFFVSFTSCVLIVRHGTYPKIGLGMSNVEFYKWGGFFYAICSKHCSFYFYLYLFIKYIKMMTKKNHYTCWIKIFFLKLNFI